MCNENKISSSFDSLIAFSKNFSKCSKLITAQSIISSFKIVNSPFSVSFLPFKSSNTIETTDSLEIVLDFSEPKKSPVFILETCVLESEDHFPIL